MTAIGALSIASAESLLLGVMGRLRRVFDKWSPGIGGANGETGPIANGGRVFSYRKG